jgi:hypothetical protein
MRIMGRPRFWVAAWGGLLVAAMALAVDVDVIEDWSAAPIGSKGIPPGWHKQDWGSPRYDFTVVEEGGQRVIHLTSTGDSSNVNKDIRGKVHLAETPILEWTWKVADRQWRHGHRALSVRSPARGARHVYLDDGRDVRAAQAVAARVGHRQSPPREGPCDGLRRVREQGYDARPDRARH